MTALGARSRLADIAPHLRDTVASYRAGYLAEDRRALERALADGELRGLAATNALELGIDISGLDAVVLAGFPGPSPRSGSRPGGAGGAARERWFCWSPATTRAGHLPRPPPGRLARQAGRTGGHRPSNPYVMGPQLLCAASELPLAEAEVSAWKAGAVVEAPAADGLLRHRGGRYFAAAGLDPHHDVDIRGTSGGQVAIVESDTGRLLGSTDAGQAPTTVHPGRCICTRVRPIWWTPWTSTTGLRSSTPKTRVRDVRPRTHRHHRDRRRGAGGFTARSPWVWFRSLSRVG